MDREEQVPFQPHKTIQSLVSLHLRKHRTVCLAEMAQAGFVRPLAAVSHRRPLDADSGFRFSLMVSLFRAALSNWNCVG